MRKTTTTAKVLFSALFSNSHVSEMKQHLGSPSPCNDSIHSCVPNQSFFLEVMRSQTGKHSLQQTPLKIVAAYDYSNYLVVTTEAIGWFGKRVFCRYLDRNRRELGSAMPSTMFPDSVVYCCNRSGAYYMAVTEGAKNPYDEASLVIDRRIDASKYFLSICLAPLYGSKTKWLLLAELFEHYKLQGVEHFYVYIIEMDRYSKKLIDYYVRSGEVEVILLENKHVNNVIATQIIGVTECLQRSRHHSRYALFVDLDERVMPRHGDTLSSFVRKTLTDVPNRAMLRFTSRWVFRTSSPPSVYKGEKTLKKHLPMMVYRNSSAVPPRRIIQKCVLDPKHVLIHFVHQVRAFYPGYDGYEVPFEDLHLRHYREISSGNWSNEWMERIKHYGPFEATGYSEDHISELYRNVKNKLDVIYNR
ncbi:hypothetical protein Y032_0006g2822 [Ancylostoma ceylanicum]|uniref:Glycosyltransferase family 92 protein n=3 Tax=Ancylostoma ceylanicum TaxID=53326 RepID=A0A016VNK8_9BILA|nr:hypothetical protein Y032_0006g2822 [Ancylostoma ceylanicum]